MYWKLNMEYYGKLIQGESGNSYLLGKKVGDGGEGTVYLIPDKKLVAKIYKQKFPQEEQKIRYMVYHPIDDLPPDRAIGNFSFQLAWPQDILHDESGSFIGYVMPYIDNVVEILTISRGCDTLAAQKLIPDYNRAFNVLVALNLAKTVEYLHCKNCIIGDLNHKNIFVTSTGGIVILDNDSFDLIDETTGEHYRCCVGTQDYLAPELQGRDLKSENTSFSFYSDDFSLAVHIFQLLMSNFHPFSCRNYNTKLNSSSTNLRVERIAHGISPFVHNYSDLAIPISAPTLEEILPKFLIADFYQTFCYTEAEVSILKGNRTSAAMWRADLEKYWQMILDPHECIQCKDNPTHFYLRYQHECGLCRAKKRAQKLLRQANTL